jgi:hypothetical protein
MLSSNHFYHRTIRKMVVAFGTIFNNLKLVRYNKAGTTEIERVTVPLSYAQKEKFYARITQDPGLKREVQITLPRMSFELDSISYDPLRKISNFNETFVANDSSTVRAYRSVPYNFDFSLSIYVRNVEDGTQIVEQILPYFNPDLTVTGDVLGIGKKIDLPIVLQSINSTVDAEGAPENMRMIVWTLTFTLKGYMFGPVSNSNIIRASTANTHVLTENFTNDRVLNFSIGTGTFSIGELVYEGFKLEAANVSAFVRSWNPAANQLIVTDTSGVFVPGRKIKGAVSGATWTLATTDIYSNQLAYLSVQPDPTTANANDDFGFTQIYQEYPTVGNFEVADSTLLSADNNNLSVDDNDG